MLSFRLTRNHIASSIETLLGRGIIAVAKTDQSKFTSKEFRAELVKIMPGYSWTVHKSTSEAYLDATGVQSAGFNRLSTLSVIRTVRDGVVKYEAKSAGFGLRARWLHTNTDGTLARALRGLQDHYQRTAGTYASHAMALQSARNALAEKDNRHG
jgi:hypothetical protein